MTFQQDHGLASLRAGELLARVVSVWKSRGNGKVVFAAQVGAVIWEAFKTHGNIYLPPCPWLVSPPELVSTAPFGCCVSLLPGIPSDVTHSGALLSDWGAGHSQSQAALCTPASKPSQPWGPTPSGCASRRPGTVCLSGHEPGPGQLPGRWSLHGARASARHERQIYKE